MVDVLERFLVSYKTSHRLSPQQAKVINSIQSCRTPALGGRVLACASCGYTRESYHSCRNRHCPQCQKQASDDWLARRREDLLPVPYFHLVFTLPHALNGWVQLHPEVLYPLLFEAVSTTLKRFGRDPRRLDGDIGMTLVLHTWGQNLSQHVHLHGLVPGGALSREGDQWHPARSNHLFPVKALSRAYRGLMVSLLRRAWQASLLFRLKSETEVTAVLDTVMAQPWVVFAKPTQTHTEQVLGYLARYTYRIAISDRRLVSVDEHGVCFRWKDYRNKGSAGSMFLTGEEFLRRWLMHVLPTGLMRVRHYGFLANCHRREKLQRIRDCLREDHVSPPRRVRNQPVEPVQAPACFACPRCREGMLRVTSEIERRRCSG